MDVGPVYLDAVDLIGVVGAVLVLLGFYRISIGRWTNKSLWYELDNLVGATCLVIYQLHHFAYISVVVNVVWAIIAFRGLSSIAQRRAVKSAGKRKRRAKS